MKVPLRRHLQKLKKCDQANRSIQIKVTENERNALDKYCRESGIPSKPDLVRIALEAYMGKKFFRPRTATGRSIHTRDECMRQKEEGR